MDAFDNQTFILSRLSSRGREAKTYEVRDPKIK